MKPKYLKIQLLTLITTLVLAVSAFAANNGYNQNYGRIQRLMPQSTRFYFQLADGQTLMNPTGGYYYIATTTSNYNEMCNLLRMAAENNWIVKAATASVLDANGYAQVKYLVVDF